MSDSIDNRLTIKLSADELWFLMSQFGPAYIIGMDNPHLGWLAEEIEKADRKTVQLMVKRGLIRPISEEEIEMDDAVASMVQVCVQPEHSLIVHSSQMEEGAERDRYIHLAGDWIVEHIEDETGLHRLTAFRDRESLAAYLQEDLRMNSKARSSTETFCLPEDILFTASRLYAEGKGGEGKALLQRCDLNSTIIEAIDKVLANPVANGSFVVIVNQNNPETQYVRGFGILEGETQFWLMRPIEKLGQPQVEFMSADATHARQRLIELLP